MKKFECPCIDTDNINEELFTEAEKRYLENDNVCVKKFINAYYGKESISYEEWLENICKNIKELNHQISNTQSVLGVTLSIACTTLVLALLALFKIG